METLIAEPHWVAGLVLYWGEGGKSRSDLKMANADPRALRLFIDWVRTYLDADAEFSMQLHLHEGNDEGLARQSWRHATGLTKANFYKTFMKPRGTGHKKNHLSNGVCTVRVRKCADHWQMVMAWIDGLTAWLGLD